MTETPANPSSVQTAPRAWGRWLFRWGQRCFALIGLGMVLYYLLFDLSTMVSGSMTPTLNGTKYGDGDYVLTEKVSYWFRSPRRWEVITFTNDEGVHVMKRVVGLPGEGVRQYSFENPLEIDGAPLEIPARLDFLKYYPYGFLSDRRTVRCGEGYFLLGDDSKDSDDSRFNGPLPRQRIIGRAWLIVWPLSRFGFVNPSQ